MQTSPAKDALTQWVQSRAASDDDARVASKLIAGYVAECVRQDRARQAVKSRVHEIFAAMREAAKV